MEWWFSNDKSSKKCFSLLEVLAFLFSLAGRTKVLAIPRKYATYTQYTQSICYEIRGCSPTFLKRIRIVLQIGGGRMRIRWRNCHCHWRKTKARLVQIHHRVLRRRRNVHRHWFVWRRAGGVAVGERRWWIGVARLLGPGGWRGRWWPGWGVATTVRGGCRWGAHNRWRWGVSLGLVMDLRVVGDWWWLMVVLSFVVIVKRMRGLRWMGRAIGRLGGHWWECRVVGV